jgi:membrane protein DedA with SNARE-associated domain
LPCSDAHGKDAAMPADLTQLLELIRANGEVIYTFLFGYAAVHALLIVLFAGYAAHMGALDWSKVFLVCWAGAVAGDAIRFWVGRRFGTRWLERFPRLNRAVLSIVRLVDRHYALILLIHRYPNGVRNIAGFACGVASIPASTFFAINVASAAIWSAAVVGAGYGFAYLSEKVLADAASGVSVAALIVFLGLFWILSRRLEQAAESDVRK